MQEFLKVTGMVIGVFPQGEMDRRITLLTREAGKITAFVKGARRQGSRFCATTDLFAFGTFDLYVGKTSLNVQNVEVLNYFEFLRTDLEAACYGMYFSELSEFYALENNDESVLLLLLYRALQGLKSEKLSNDFVRSVFEIKLFMIEGEFIPIERLGSFSDSVYSCIDYLFNATIEKLYNFKAEASLKEALKEIAIKERNRLVDKHLQSLDVLETML